MLTQAFGELLTDILTVNPAIKSIPSASSILDTSNYTFNAVTLGKDAAGFLQHGHSLFTENYIGDVLAVITNDFSTYTKFNDGFLTTLRYNNTSPSSYHTSATHLQLSSAYNSIPNYPSIYDNRLERGSTRTSLELYRQTTFADFGHYINPVIDDRNLSSLNILLSSAYFSSLWNAVGYPPSGNTGKFRLVSSVTALTTPAVSGSLSGVFNSQAVIDRNGFIKINEAKNTTSLSSGPYVISSTGFLTDPGVIIGVGIQRGDAVALSLLGGVNHVGVWCLDLKEMLKSGLNPPYSWNNINNLRKYKLVGKVTFWDDILYNEDVSTNSGLSLLDTNGVLVKLKFNFK